MTVGFYNYYNIQGRYSPSEPDDWYQNMVDEYEKNSDSLKHYNENPYSEENLKIKEFDDKLASMAETLRSKFKTVDEVRHYLGEKYFNMAEFGYTKKWQEPEKYAMYENDLKAVLFGQVGKGINRNDPRFNYSPDDWEEYDKQKQTDSLNILNFQMKNLLKNHNVELNENDSFLISFDPYTYKAGVEGELDTEIIEKITQALNSDENSKELFFYAFQNSSSLNPDSVDKMRAYNEVLKHTGYGLNELVLKDGEYYSKNGVNILELVKNSIKEDSSISSEFKNDAFDYIKNLLKKVSKVGCQNIEDINLSLIYSNKDGFYLSNKTYSA